MMQDLTNINIESGKIFGNLGKIKILPSELTVICLKKLSDGEEKVFNASEFKRCTASKKGDGFSVVLSSPGGICDIDILVDVCLIGEKASLKTQIKNNNPDFTVMYADYPHLVFEGSDYDAFLPKYGGIAEKNIMTSDCSHKLEDMLSYPCGFHYTMQYFAFWNSNASLYTAVHDENGALKRFGFETNKEKSSVEFVCRYPAEGMGLGANSFSLAGEMVWQCFEDDWYDATLIYKDFVINNAKWLGEKYRPDTPESFKNIPLWVMDWLPNLPGNPDPLPESVRPKEENPDPERWIKRPIALKEKLGIPIGYHLYNWHKIPFNNDLPHYFPEKDGVKEGIKKLRENGISVMPYINAKLWDTLDKEDTDFEFSSKAKKWAAKKLDGSVYTEQHASHEKTGELCTLAMMCPTTEFWHDKISEVVGKLFYELGVDGVYMDQIAASMPRPCCDKDHDHAPGGGSWWVRGYEKMLKRLQKEKPAYGYLTTECNAESFAKHMDGFLTWVWLHSNSVPAFSAIYSNYVTMFGRNTNGKKADDTPFFKSNLAESFLYGQSLGWINPQVLSDPEKLDFLTKIAKLRYEKTKVFTHGTLLRPPSVTSDITDTCSEPAMSFTEPYIVSYVKSGIWQREDGKCEIYVINTSTQSANAEIVFEKSKYDIDFSKLSKECGNGSFEVEVSEKTVLIKALIEPNDYVVLQL